MNRQQLFRKLPYLFFVLSLLLLVVSMLMNRSYFHHLAYGSVVWYQTKQVLSLLFLFAVGYAFVKVIQHHLPELWVCLLAFPTAVCLWCFCSEFLLLADFTYRFWRVCFLIGAGILVCCLFRRIRHIPLAAVTLPIGRTLAVVAGVCCLVSTGWNYIILNYDSYFYFSDYGKALTLMMSYKDIVSDNSFVLTNIGQFLPLVSSYMTYWGLDSGAPVLGFFIINLFAAFGTAVYEQVHARFGTKRAAGYAGVSLLLLASCSIFFLYTHWILSNTYILFYLFLLFYLGSEHWKSPSVDRALLIGLYTLAVTMLRKEGLIIVCFLFICYSARKLYASWILALLFLPSAAYQIFYIYWLRHIIYARTTLAFGTSLLSDNFMKMMLLGIVATFCYLLVLHFLAERILKRYLMHVMTLFLIAALCLFMSKDLTLSVDFIDTWLRNFSGIGFGFCSLQILLLVTLVLLVGHTPAVRNEKSPKDREIPRYGYSLFFVLGNVLITFIIYLQKRNLDVGIDNSGLRALYQIIPVFYYAAMTAIAPLFEKPMIRKSGNQSEPDKYELSGKK